MDTDTWVRGGITSEEENVFFSHVYLKLLVSLVLMVSLLYIYMYIYMINIINIYNYPLVI